MADNAQSILRRWREITDDPRGFLEMIKDRIDNFNKGRVAEIRPEGAGYRTLTQKERTAQIVGGALDNLGSGGMGALGVIKGKGGNWLTGSVENALSGLKKRLPGEARDAYGNIVPAVIQPHPADIALNNWIEGPLTKYVKRDMATEGDPVRRLAEQGVTHIAPEQLYYGAREIHPSGEVLQKLGQSPTARAWENASDYAIASSPAETYQNFGSSNLGLDWVNKLDPKTPFYRTYGQLPGDLGFSHLTDELANALNPESGLPRQLLLTPEQMQQMGMERAVRHVHNINQWRAAQKAEADAARANNAATVLHKEYPENNLRGLRWVELKAPDRWPEGIDPAKKEEFGDLGRYSRSTLADSLKYEGDTMGHCVGGYCDDVLSGRSRIFSLRDAKGQPHVTIETSPNLRGLREYLSQFEHPEKPGRLVPDKLGITDTLHDYVQANRKGNGDYDDFGLEMLKKFGHPLPPDSIIQIKGKQNKAPNPEYLPFVQDFVKSGKWSDVGDLSNTGLFRTDKLRKGATLGLPEADYQALHKAMYEANPDLVSFSQGLSELIPEGVEYMTRDELMNLIKPKQNFAQGGSVKPTTWRPMELGGIIGYITE